MIALMPPSMPCSVPRSPRVTSRPPAYRRMVRGRASRKAAIVFSASLPSTTGKSPNGVPGRGFRKLSGTSSGSSSASCPASSARRSPLLPPPTQPPQQNPLLAPPPQPDQAATANLHAGFLDELQRLPALFPRVGRHDLREVGAGGLEV